MLFQQNVICVEGKRAGVKIEEGDLPTESIVRFVGKVAQQIAEVFGVSMQRAVILR